MALIGNLNLRTAVDLKGLKKGISSMKREMNKLKREWKQATTGFTGISKAVAGAAFVIKKSLSLAIGVVANLAQMFLKLAFVVGEVAVKAFLKLGKVAAIVLTAITVAVLKIGTGFERAMSRVSGFGKVFGKQLLVLQGRAEELGMKTIFSAKQGSEGMAILAKAGFSYIQMYKALPSVLSMAAAGEIEVAEAAEYATKIMRQSNIEAEDFTRVVDAMAYAASSSVTDMRELAEAMKYVGPIGTNLQVPVEDTIMLLQAMADSGIIGERAGASLRNIYSRLSGGVPTAANKLKELGVVIADGRGNMKSFVDIIGQFEQKLAGMTSLQKTSAIMEIFEQRAGPSFMALIQKSSKGLYQMRKEIHAAGGAADQLANILWNNVTGKLLITRSIVSGIAIKIYNAFKGPLKRGIEILNARLTENIDTFVEWGKTVGMWITKAIMGLDVLYSYLKDNGAEAWASFGSAASDALETALITGITTAIKKTTVLLAGLVSEAPKLLKFGVDIYSGREELERRPKILERAKEKLKGLTPGSNEYDYYKKMIKQQQEGMVGASNRIRVGEAALNIAAGDLTARVQRSFADDVDTAKGFAAAVGDAVVGAFSQSPEGKKAVEALIEIKNLTGKQLNPGAM